MEAVVRRSINHLGQSQLEEKTLRGTKEETKWKQKRNVSDWTERERGRGRERRRLKSPINFIGRPDANLQLSAQLIRRRAKLRSEAEG